MSFKHLSVMLCVACGQPRFQKCNFLLFPAVDLNGICALLHGSGEGGTPPEFLSHRGWRAQGRVSYLLDRPPVELVLVSLTNTLQLMVPLQRPGSNESQLIPLI